MVPSNPYGTIIEASLGRLRADRRWAALSGGGGAMVRQVVEPCQVAEDHGGRLASVVVRGWIYCAWRYQGGGHGA